MALKLKIKTKLFFILLGVGLLPATIFGFFNIYNAQRELKNEILSKLLVLAEAKEGQIFAYLDFLESEAGSFASDGVIKSKLGEITTQGSKEAVDLLNQHLILNKLPVDKAIVGILVMDTEGKVVASTNSEEVGESEAGDDYFIKGLKDVVSVDLRREKHFGLIDSFVAAAPVTNVESGKVLGVIAIFFRTEKLADILSGKFQEEKGALTGNKGLSKTTEIYLVDKEKRMFVHPPGNHGHGELNYPEMIVNTEPVKNCLERGEETISAYRNYSGEEVLGSSMCITEKGWTLLVEVHASEAFAATNRTWFLFGSTSVLFLAVVGVLAAFFGRKFSDPIKKLHEGSEIIGEGKYDYRLHIKTGDELEQLGEAFNQMADQLKAYTSGLAEKLKERTKELAEKIEGLKLANQSAEELKAAMLNLLEDAKALEEDLKKERDRATGIISSMGESLLVLNRSYEIVLMNPAAETLLEVSAKDAVGRPWSDFTRVYLADKEIPIRERSAVKALESGHAVTTRVEDDHYYEGFKTKRRFPVVAISAPLKSGEDVIGVVKVFRDATFEKEHLTIIERAVAERTRELRDKNVVLEEAKRKVSEGWLMLQEEKARLMAAIQSLPRGFILTDVEGQILITNQLLEKILGPVKGGWTLSEVQNRLTGYVEVQELFRKCISEKRSIILKDIPFVSRILNFFITPVFIEAGKIIGTMILFEDVTEAKILERSKDEFFSIASHELRTPLTAIRGNASMILDYFSEQVKDQELREMLDDIHTSSVRLIEIVNDFLNMSRLEQGKITFHNQAFQIEELVTEVLDELAPQAKQKNLALTLVDAKKKYPAVFVDRDRTKEVLLNIIGNALKFTEKGEVKVTLAPKGNQLEVAVSDTGRGISYKNQRLLFRKFQQAGDSLYTRDTTRGTGLGLYISKLMVEGMGGKIYLVKSVEGVGSTFALTLPGVESEKK